MNKSFSVFASSIKFVAIFFAIFVSVNFVNAQVVTTSVVVPAIPVEGWLPSDIDTSCIVLTQFMEYRTSSPQVSALQNFFVDMGYLEYEPTGFFGRATEQAVRRWQFDHHVDTLGYAGPNTRASIANVSCKGDQGAIATAQRGPNSTFYVDGVAQKTFKVAVTAAVKKTTTVATTKPVTINTTTVVTQNTTTQTQVENSGTTVVIPTTNINSSNTAPTNNETIITENTTAKLSSNGGTFYLGRNPVNSVYFTYKNDPYTNSSYMCLEKAGESKCSSIQNYTELTAGYDPSNYDAIPSGNKWLLTFYQESRVNKVYMKSALNLSPEIFTITYSNSQ